LLLLYSKFLPAQQISDAKIASQVSGEEICLVWYNVENLFYPEDDSIAGDDEFTPRGLRHWTWFRYRAKLTAIAKVIVAAGGGEAPGLVGLCEVENAQVLQDLCAHPILLPYQYTFLHRDSHDHRGMDVACLFRGGRTELVHWENIAPASPLTDTRDLLHISLKYDEDTLDVFLVHLISKYGGAGATAALRKSQARQLAQKLDSVYCKRQKALLIAAGDFNEDFEAYAMEPLRTARFGKDSLIVLLPGDGQGSYKFRGRWSPIDQVLTLQYMQGFMELRSLHLPPLLTEDLKFGGRKPKRCYEGMKYKGGISDHLPLVLRLSPFSFSVPAEQ